jgi:AcrR family transcriptional regulator
VPTLPSAAVPHRLPSVGDDVAVAVPTKRKPGRPRNTSSEDTKLRILEAAVDCFADGGFDGTASLTIAERAGVTPATIYHHFSNKRTLYIAAFQHSIDVAWTQYADVAEDANASVVDEVMAVVRQACEIMRTRPAMTLLAIRAQIDVASSEIHVDAVTELFASMVARATERGELREEDAVMFADSVAMFLWGLSVVGRHDDDTRTRCADALERVLRNTLITAPR